MKMLIGEFCLLIFPSISIQQSKSAISVSAVGQADNQ
jgi:hypothetical protein